MHQHEGSTPLRRDASQLRVVFQAADVVHDGGAGIECRPSHLGFVGIDRKRYAHARGQRSNHRNNTCRFLRGRGGLGARSRRLAAHVNHIGSSLFHAQRDLDGRVDVHAAIAHETNSIAEGIRGDVQNGHHKAAMTQG